jgi:hypothetical protein
MLRTADIMDGGLNSERMPHLGGQLSDRASVLARCVMLVGKIEAGSDNDRDDQKSLHR